MLKRPQSLTSLLLQELESQILSGRIGPGEPINEKAFAERNAVSRGPIREACRRLEEAGLVTIIPNRGVFVRKLELDDAIEICDIRAMLAGYAGRILAGSITPGQLADLTALAEAMEATAEAGDVEEYYPINSKFHGAIFEFAGNRRLADMYAAISKELHLFRWRALLVSPNLQKSVREHREILGALAEHNAQHAALTMEEHTISVKNRIIGSGLGE